MKQRKLILKFLLLLGCFLSAFTSALQAQVNLNNGLVAYLPLDNNRLDYSGNANNGNASGNTSFIADRFGNANSAASFGGTSSAGKITIPHSSSLTFSTGVTFACWARVSSATGTFGNGSVGAGGSQCLFAKGGDAGGGFWQLSSFSSSTLNNQIGNNATPSLSGALSPYALNQWFHYVVTMDASGHRIYVNGELQSSNTEAANLAALTNRNLVLGRFDSNWYPLNGAIDEFRVYNRVLTLDEIAALSNDDVASISISINGSTFCAGSSIDINYTTTGALAAQNTYTFQLSSATGSFTTPLSTQTLQSNANSGTYTFTLPNYLPSGTEYALRVLSNAPNTTSNTISNLTINGVVGDIVDASIYNFVGSLNGNHYFLRNATTNVHQARSDAQQSGGHLAYIPDAATNNMLRNSLSATNAYIGLSDEITEGQWRWDNNLPLTYTNWATNEPNGGTNENHVTMQVAGPWVDVNANQLRLSFMQFKPAGIEQIVCEGDNVTLNATALTGATYLWSGPNGFTSSELAPSLNNVTFLQNGEYALTYTKNGCSVTERTRIHVRPRPADVGQSAPLPAAFNTNLRLHYPMNGNANDASGNNLHGSVVGGVTGTSDRFGNENSALALNGSNGHLQAPNGVYFDGSDFTVSTWVRKISNNNWSRIMDFGNGQLNNNIVFALSQNTTGRPVADLFNGNTSVGQIVSPTAVPNNQWVLITYTWSATIGTLYMNGNVLTSGVQQAPLNVVRTLNYIGRSNWSVDAYANGSFDDFRIYDRALSAAEIQWMLLEQPNTVELFAVNSPICNGSTAQIVLRNSQPGVSYQLQNATTLANVGTAQAGTGDSLVFTTPILNENTSYQVLASVGTGCNRTLSEIIEIEVNPFPPTPTAQNDTVCNSGEMTISVSGGTDFRWYTTASGGTPTAITGNSYETGLINETQRYFVAAVDNAGCESERVEVAAVVINPLNPPVNIVNNVIIHYKYDGDVNDYSGNDYHGTLFGSNSYVVDRNNNSESALSTISSSIPGNNYMSAGNPLKIQQLTNQVTYSMWIRQTQTWFGSSGTDGQMPLINKWDGSNGMWIGLRMQNPSNMSNRVRWRVNSSTFLESNTNVPVGTWHHIVCTYNGAQLRIYQNGVLTGTLNHTGAIANTGVPLSFGRQANGGGDITYRGDWDEVKVFNRALNSSEIQTLFNNESVAFANTPFCDEQGTLTLTTFDFPGASYAWTGPNGFTSNLQNPTPIANADSLTYSGIYTLVVNAQGCTSLPQEVNAIINGFPTAPIVINDTVCGSGNAVLTAQGAVNGNYRWYTAASGGTPISGQTNGTLTISNVTASQSRFVSIIRNGCEGPRAEVQAVYLPSALTDLTVSGSTVCQSDSEASVTINASETGVTYQAFLGANPIGASVSGGGTIQLIIQVSSLAIGNNTISIRATQANCGPVTLTNTAIIEVQATPSATISASGSLQLCEGQSVVLTANASNAYLWSTGATTQSITVSTAGSFSVQVSNGAGCSAQSSELTTSISPVPTVTITASGALEFCEGGSVVLQASGADSYVWSNGATGAQLTVSQSGNYSVTGTTNGCSATSTAVAVQVNPVPSATITASGPLAFCDGGSVTLSVPSGNTYLWSTGATTNSISVSASGNYSVTVTNTSGCSAQSQSVAVDVTPLPTATITASGATTFCAGGNVTLTASAGTSYLWSTGATTQSITVNQSGNYSVTVSNGSCSATSVATNVTVNAAPTVTASASATSVCAGQSVILTGSGASTYTWNNGVSNGVAFTPSATTTYTVTGTDANGCTANSTVQVSVLPLPNANFTSSSPSVCAGGTVTLTAQNTSLANYDWFLNGTALALNGGSSISASAPGDYSLTVTSAAGCTNTSSLTILQGQSPTVSISASATSFCVGSSQLITATSITGATYQWLLNGNPTGSPSVGGNTIHATTAGTYSVTVTSSAGCSATSNTLVLESIALPTVSITASETSFCAGGSSVLTASNVASATYQWLLNGTPIAGATAQTYTATSAGSYQVQVTTTCTGLSNAIQIVVNPMPNNAAAIQGANSLCAGSSATYSVANSANATSYQWTITPAGSASIGAGQGTTTVTVNATNQNFTLSVTPQNACGAGGASSLAVVTSTAFPCDGQVLFSANTTNTCTNSPIVFTNHTNPSLFAGLTPRWNFGAGASPATANGNGPHTVTYATAGQKTVRLEYVDQFNNVFDEEVKTNYITISGTVTTSPITGENSISCASTSQSYSVVNTVGSTYTWTVPSGMTIVSGQGTNQITVNPNGSTGTISVVESNQGGCQGAAVSLTITLSNPVTTSAINGPSTVSCSQQNVVYSVTNTTGSSYQWTVPSGATIVSGQGTNSITVSFNGSTGVISVQESNAAGCSGTVVSLTVECTSSIEETAQQLWKVYPNPTQDYFNIDFPTANETTSFKLFDAQGKLIFEESLNIQNQINVETYATGFYHGVISHEGKTHSIKVVKH
jgi:hypothetical protein